MKIHKNRPRTGKPDLLCSSSWIFIYIQEDRRCFLCFTALSECLRLFPSRRRAIDWIRHMTSVFDQYGGNSSIVLSLYCQFQICFLEKAARFCSLSARQDDSHGFLWVRFYSVWTCPGVVFSHCSERCSASDRVDCKVGLSVSCTVYNGVLLLNLSS